MTESHHDRAARDGFLTWVTALVHAQRARLVGVARRKGLAPEDALDCVQEAFSTFLTLPDADRLAAREDEAGRVLATLVAHGALNQRRKVERRAELPEEAAPEQEALLPSADALVEAAEQRVGLVRCVERLGRMQRAVVQLRLVDERDGEEVSEVLGLSAPHVRVLLFRARRQLRECLALSEALDAPR